MKMVSRYLDNAKLGDIVYVRYLDHLLLKNMEQNNYPPVITEMLGWLVEDQADYIRVEFERFSQIGNGVNVTQKMSSLTIIKSTILELRKIV
nr:hypothetical protein [Candidatus Freyarchaeota archaeon]